MSNKQLKIWLTVYDDDDGGTAAAAEAAAAAAAAAAATADPPAGDNFTQDQVNTFLKKEKEKDRAKYQKVIDELEAFKSRSSLSDTHRKDLEKQIEGYKSQMMTKEELAARDKDKLVTQHKGVVDELTNERDTWKTRYTSSTITRSIQDAAIENGAFFPEQVAAIIAPKTTLLEAVDDDGEPTGVLVPSVEFSDVDSKTSKPVTLTLSVGEAVKRMTEIDKYFNLFKTDGSSGVGRTNRGGGKTLDMAALAKDPVAYRKAKKEGKI